MEHFFRGLVFIFGALVMAFLVGLFAATVFQVLVTYAMPQESVSAIGSAFQSIARDVGGEPVSIKKAVGGLMMLAILGMVCLMFCLAYTAVKTVGEAVSPRDR